MSLSGPVFWGLGMARILLDLRLEPRLWFFFFKISFIYFLNSIYFIFREREWEGKRKGERNINVWLSLACPLPAGDLACNPGMCPDWDSNQQLFALQASAQSTEPYQPGLFLFLERREGRKKERKRNINVQKKYQSVAS